MATQDEYNGEGPLPPPRWVPSEHAVSFERFRHPTDNGPETILVSHPTAPFVAEFEAPSFDKLEDALRGEAFSYLQALKAFDPLATDDSSFLPQNWEDAINPNKAFPGDDFFGWLPIAWPTDGDGKKSNAQQSSRAIRRGKRPKESGEADTITIILVAGETLPLDTSDTGAIATNSGFGLQVIMNVVEIEGRLRVSISTMIGYLPYASYVTLIDQPIGAGAPLFQLIGAREGRPEELLFTRMKIAFVGKQLAIARRANLDKEAGIAVNRLRFLFRADEGKGSVLLEIGGIGRRAFSTDQSSTAHGITARFPVFGNVDGSDSSIELIRNVPLVTNASAPGHARVFREDPVSKRAGSSRPVFDGRRPTASEEQLDVFRQDVQICSGGGASCELVFPTPPDDSYFWVRNCPDFVSSDPSTPIKMVSLPAGPPPGVREDEQSALNAFYHFREMFELMEQKLDIDPANYMDQIEGPLHVFYRSGISPGPGKDGDTVNARVKFQGPREFDGFRRPIFLDGDPLILEVHLALGNHSHRARRVDPANSEPTPAEPLGIATSQRWMWHEFGHVLIAARLHVLEFLFAHSIGDALAAVYADPFSRLADEKNLRGFTFPWVFLNRRHDRCVLNGWSWSGRLQRAVTEAPEYQHDNLKGYLSEQILSSTLFRLYRILGGDTRDGGNVPDVDTRETASLVVLYLVIDGLEKFGGVEPTKVDAFEAVMISSDGHIPTPLNLPLRSGTNHGWKAGLTHKVIRWAFEAQGLHPPPNATIHNAPGIPPSVDIYMEDRRPREEITDHLTVTHGPGGYPPVSIDWNAAKLWMAGQFDRDNLGGIPIKIRNRGRETATNLKARFWLGSVATLPSNAGWDRSTSINWFHNAVIALTSTTVAPDETLDVKLTEVLFDPSEADAQGYVLLVEVTSPEDHANSDAGAMLPNAIPAASNPPTVPRELSDLAANDNNLALWVTW